MTTPKLCPETIKACIEALPVPYTLNPNSVVQCVAECRKALEALLPDPARALVEKYRPHQTTGMAGDMDIMTAFARWLLSSGYLKEREG